MVVFLSLRFEATMKNQFQIYLFFHKAYVIIIS